ncbi:MAG: hypothetical protein Q9188_005377 [Gyalolechia gomerana]
MHATTIVPPTQKGSLESYLAANESSRICYPTTSQWPLPVNRKLIGTEDVENAKISVTILKELNSAAPIILQKHKLFSPAFPVRNWQWKFDDQPKREVLTVYTTADWDSAAWLQAAEEIHSLLLSNGVPESTVELINLSRVNYKEITAECVPQADREYYCEIQDSIFKIVMHELKTALVYVGLHMYSEASFVCKKPCLFIFAKPGSVCDWVELSAHLLQVFGDRFQLQFRPGRYVPLAAEHGLPPPPGKFDPSLRTGASISRVDDLHRGGTSGIFFDLEVNQTSPRNPSSLAAGVHKTLLTCHHVIAPPEDTADYQEVHKHGYPLLSKPYANPQIVCPSHRKLQERISALEADMAADKADLEKRELSLSRKAIATLKSEIKTLQKELESRRQLQSSRRPIGQVLFSAIQVINTTQCQDINPTDCKLHDHFLLDLALIQLSTHDLHWNIAPLPRECKSPWYDVTGLAQPLDEMRVFKYGSQTGITSGRLSGQTFFAHDAGLGWFQGWAIIADDEDRRFSEGGDSASAITTSTGELVGQLHGAVIDPAHKPISCMTPIEPIINFLKARIPNSDVTFSTDTPPVVDSPLGIIQNFVASIGSKLWPWKEQDDSLV